MLPNQFTLKGIRLVTHVQNVRTPMVLLSGVGCKSIITGFAKRTNTNSNSNIEEYHGGFKISYELCIIQCTETATFFFAKFCTNVKN